MIPLKKFLPEVSAQAITLKMTNNNRHQTSWVLETYEVF